MRIFNIDKNISVACISEGTRSGFRHVATAHKNGFEIARVRLNYLNRTWERYEFESAINDLAETVAQRGDIETGDKIIKFAKSLR
jgi:hypothetical protein